MESIAISVGYVSTAKSDSKEITSSSLWGKSMLLPVPDSLCDHELHHSLGNVCPVAASDAGG